MRLSNNYSLLAVFLISLILPHKLFATDYDHGSTISNVHYGVIPDNKYYPIDMMDRPANSMLFYSCDYSNYTLSSSPSGTVYNYETIVRGSETRGYLIFYQDWSNTIYTNSIVKIERYVVTGICDYTFYGLSDLKSPGSDITSSEITLPKSLEWIGKYAFYGCSGINGVKFPVTLKSIGEGAFEACDGLWLLSSLYYCDGITKIEPYVFKNCKNLIQIDLPPNIEEIGNSAFSGCDVLEYCRIPEKVRYIGAAAFAQTNFKYITIPNSVEEIGMRAFTNIARLEKVTIGKNVKKIDYGAFGCTVPSEYYDNQNIQSVVALPNVPPTCPDGKIFSDKTYQSAILFVPKGTKEEYSQTPGWSQFANIIECDGEYVEAEKFTVSCEHYEAVSGEADYSQKPLVLLPGTTHELHWQVFPENATDNRLKWSVKDESVARINENHIEIIGEGSTYIYAEHLDSRNLLCKIPLIGGQPIEEINVTSEISIEIDKTRSLGYYGPKVEFLPINCSSKSVRYISENPNIVSVNNNKGEFTGLQLGDAILRVEATDGSGVKAYAKVSVVPQKVEKINLNTHEITNRAYSNKWYYDNYQLNGTVSPSKAPQDIIWTSSNERVVSVDSNGLLTFHCYGSATIRACAQSDPKIYDECKITVDGGVDIALNGYVSSYMSFAVNTEDNLLSLQVLPSTLQIEDFQWDDVVIDSKTSEPIAKIDSNGYLNVLKTGKGYISCTFSLLGKEVHLTKLLSTDYTIKDIYLPYSSIELCPGDKLTIPYTYAPADATDFTIKFESSDENVAKINDNGEITAVGIGNCTIKIKSSYSIYVPTTKATCEIIVKPRLAESIILNVDNWIGTPNQTFTLNAIVYPDNTTDRAVVWSSSDPTVAIVDEDGVVTTIGVGEAIITAVTSNGLSASCKVNIIPIPVESIVFDTNEHQCVAGDSFAIKAIILPDNAFNKQLYWMSSDVSVATVDENGLVNAIAAGRAIVTATTVNGLTATYTVKVIAKIGTSGGLSYEIIPGGGDGEGGEKKPSITITGGETDPDGTLRIPDDIEIDGVKYPVTEVAPGAFKDRTDIKEVVISKNVETVGDEAFAGCTNLKKVVEEDGEKLLTFGKDAFKDAPIEELYHGRNHGGNPYAGNDNLTKVEIGDKVTAIGSGEYAACKNITDVVITNPVPPVLADDAFEQAVFDRATLTVPDGSKDAYKAAAGWNKFFTVVEESEIPVVSVEMDVTALTLVEGTSQQLIATVTPDDATDASLIWTSSNTEVATVGADGTVTAVKAGTATITATTANGLTATCAVTVTAKPADTPVEPEQPGDDNNTGNGDDDSAIDGVEADGAGGVSVVDGNIVAPEGSVVYDLSGRQVKATNLPAGVYIVRTPAGNAVKVRL